MRKRLPLLICSVVLLGAVGGYWYASPRIALERIRVGLVESDQEILDEHIDFPVLRRNLKEQLNASLIERTTKESESNFGEAFGALFVGAILNKAIDWCVTPSGLAELAAGGRLELERGDDEKRGDKEKLFEDAILNYDSLSKVSIWVDAGDKNQTQFVLTRTGMSWKLTNVVMSLAESGERREPVKKTVKVVAKPVAEVRTVEKVQEPLEPVSEGIPWVAVNSSTTIDEIEVYISDVRVVPNTWQESAENHTILRITVTLKNQSTTKKAEYRSWGRESLFESHDLPKLVDNFNNGYDRITFGLFTRVEGQVIGSRSIYPGEFVTDLLFFQRPVKTCEFLRLSFSASYFGGEGEIRIEIPASAVQG